MTLIRQLVYIFSPKERVEGALLLFCLGLAALLEACAIGLVAPLVAVLNDPKHVFEAPITRPFLHAFHVSTPQQLQLDLGLCLVSAFVVKSVYLVFLYRWLFRFVHDKQASLTRQLISGYLDAPYTFHLQRNTAELIKGTTETMQRFIHGFLLMLSVVFSETLVILALALLLLAFKPLATIGAALVLGVPAFVTYRLLQRRLGEAGRLAETSMASMIQWTEQAIGGVKEALVLDRASYFVERHSTYTRQFADSWRSFGFLSNIPRLMIDMLTVGALVGILLIIVERGQDVQSLLPVLGLFAVAAIRLMPSATRIAQGFTHLRFNYVTIETLYNQLRELDQLRAERPIRALSEEPTPMLFRQSILLEHVSYAYPGAGKHAVDDVSLEIPRGQWVAFVGPTGAGKTSLVEMILGLFVPTSGRILVDGRNINDDLAAWRRNIGYVPQDVYLMDDTIRRNVAFGLQDDAIDDEKVWGALAAAQVEWVVRALPEGLDAMIGQRGDRISGGERQRLGLARALFHRPEVLVVDEGTANLDQETEAAVAQVLYELRGLKTIIMIAHRLALVKNCDQVFILRDGRVSNAGSYHELVATDAAFRQFVGDLA